jgi:Peptidase inhibitor family I36
MQRWVRRSWSVLAAAALLALGAAATAGAAGAAASCPIGGACLYSGANETGTQVQLGGGFACHSAASLGLPAVRSAVNNAVERTILLYVDASCRTPASPAFVVRQVDDINPPALSVRIRPLP